MPDVFTPAKRSEVMSRIRSTGNAATELRLVALLRAEKITGWRRHVALSLGIAPQPQSSSPTVREKAKAKAAASTSSAAPAPRAHRARVRPDFVFRQQRVAVFVDGCFWHGCPTHGTRPRQNRKFWDAKIARNRERDRLVVRGLRQQGWTVLRLWECALAKKRQAQTLGRLKRALGG